MRHVGVVVSPDSVTAVRCGTKGASTPWVRIAPRSDDLTADLASVLEDIPRARWVRHRVTVVLDEIVTSKIVRGLPETTRTRSLSRVIAATPERFFLGERGTAVTTNIAIVAPGVVIAAAVPEVILSSIVGACAVTRCTLVRVVVADYVRRILNLNEASAIDIAIGSMAAGRRASVAIVPRRRHRRLISGRTAAFSGAIFAAALIIPVMLSPLLHARSADHRVKEIALLAPARARALKIKSALDSVSNTIGVISRFSSRRYPVTFLLYRLSLAMPEGTAIVSLQSDSGGITTVAVAPSATDVIRSLAGMPGITDLQINGAVTRDVTTHQQVSGSDARAVSTALPFERVTLRFRVNPEVLMRGKSVDVREASERM